VSILKELCFELIPENIPAIASGATPIGSAHPIEGNRLEEKYKVAIQGQVAKHFGNNGNFDYIVDEI
jgi:hypothetical protein